jgi:hypothetical protein
VIHLLYLFQTTPLVCKIFEKDFLSDILDFLELPTAKYSADVGVTENDLFTSTCSIFLELLPDSSVHVPPFYKIPS